MKLQEKFGAPSKIGGWHDVTRETICTHSCIKVLIYLVEYSFI
jgi:hypothetical protein